MAFEVRCPNCNKLYAAEWRLVGKKIRCRGCQHVFPIGAPAEVPAHAAAGADAEGGDASEGAHEDIALGPDASHVGASDLAKTRQGVVVEPTKDGSTYEEAGGTPMPMLRPCVPQQFPMSDVLEAWLPLGLGLISAVWVVSETFADNQSGRSWVALLRVALVAFFYLLLVVPVTRAVIKAHFRKINRVTPPAPYQRTAFTFALPLTLGYVFWLVSNGGMTGLVTGLLMGLVMMAAVFWLLFRLDPQEAAQAYLAASASFLVTVAVSATILVGLSAALNKAMIAQNSAGLFKESPLASPLAWNVPPPAPPAQKFKPAPRHDTSAMASSHTAPQVAPAPSSNQPAPSGNPSDSNPAPSPQSPGQDTASAVQPPLIQPQNTGNTGSPTDVATNTNASIPNSNPGSRLFQIGPNSSGDAFVQKVRQLPWVKQISRPDEEAPYDLSISPLTPSPWVGFLQVSVGKMELCQLTPVFVKVKPSVQVPTAGADLSKLGTQLAVAPDGAAVLRLWNANTGSPSVEVIPVNPQSPRPNQTTLTPPGTSYNGVVRGNDALYTVELLGALPGNRFLVRWSSPDSQLIQTYAYGGHQPLVQIDLKGAYSRTVFAVDPTGAWYASVRDDGRRPSVRVDNLMNGRMTQRNCDLPADSAVPQSSRAAGLAFAPNPSSKTIALLMELNGKGYIQCWSIEDTTPGKRASFDLPRTDTTADGPHAPALTWMGDAWLVGGRTLVSNFTCKCAGSIPGDGADTVQLVSSKSTTAYLGYQADDGHERLAALSINPSALRAPTRPSSGKILIGK